MHTADPPMLLSTVHETQSLTTVADRRYLRLAQSSPLVALFGRELAPDLGFGVRGIALGNTDPLCNEWTVLALGAQIAVALIARECVDHEGGPESDRRFEFTITHNRCLVAAVARTLLDRML
jgi:DICT domain-containing protein